MTGCACACHASSGGFKITCSVDKHSSGVATVPSCSPCDSDPAGETFCVLHHKSRALATVGLVCADHHAALRETLQDILEYWALLPLYLLPGSSPVADGSQKRKNPDAPAPLNLEVVALLDRRTDDEEQRVSTETHGDRFESNGDEGLPSIPLQLAVWADMVREARGLSEGNGTVVESVRLLQAHMGWVVADRVVKQFDAQIRTMRRHLVHANGEGSPKPVGKCPTLDGAGKYCDGPLWPAGDKMEVDCGRCGRHYDERILRHLGGMLSVVPGTISA